MALSTEERAILEQLGINDLTAEEEAKLKESDPNNGPVTRTVGGILYEKQGDNWVKAKGIEYPEQTVKYSERKDGLLDGSDGRLYERDAASGFPVPASGASLYRAQQVGGLPGSAMAQAEQQRTGGSNGAMTQGQAAGLALDREKFGYEQTQDTAKAAAAQQLFQAQQRNIETASTQWFAQFNAQSQQNAASAAIAQQNLEFARTKEAFAQSQDNKRLAMDAQGQAFTQQFTLQKLQLDQANLNAQNQQRQQEFNAAAQANAAQFNASQQGNTDQFNASMGFNVAKANQDFESQKQDRLARIATDLGTTAQDPGDRGKLAVTLQGLGNRWGAGNEAASGQNYITNDSLVPTESLLRTQRDVQAQGAPYTYTPIAAPQMAATQIGGVPQPQVGALPQPFSLAGAVGSVGGSIPGGQSSGFDANNANTTWMGAQPAGTAGSSSSTTVTPNPAYIPGQAEFLAAMAAGAANKDGGGQVQGPRIVGERGIELEIPMPDGTTVILNQKQAKKHGLDLKAISKIAPGDSKVANNDMGRVLNYADGGIFGNVGNVQDSNRDLSTSFLSGAVQRARGGTPFAGGGRLPSPVFLSSPGTNPYFAQILSSLKALEEGTPQEFTLQQAAMYRPTAMSERVVGRSR